MTAFLLEKQRCPAAPLNPVYPITHPSINPCLPSNGIFPIIPKYTLRISIKRKSVQQRKMNKIQWDATCTNLTNVTFREEASPKQGIHYNADGTKFCDPQPCCVGMCAQLVKLNKSKEMIAGWWDRWGAHRDLQCWQRSFPWPWWWICRSLLYNHVLIYFALFFM